MGMALAIFHAFELEPVGVEEEHRIVVVIIFAGGIDDDHTFLLEKCLKRIDILAAARRERIVVEADIALAMPTLRSAIIGGRDPEAGIAVRPADRLLIF